MVSGIPSHLEPSELGTKEYWDEFYSADLSTPPSPSASLDGWFSDVNASSKVLKLLKSDSLRLSRELTSFLDLGTGNGEMLFLLKEQGEFEGLMVGVDYCAPSVELAKKIAIGKGLLEVQFEQWNVMQDPKREDWLPGFDVVLDKGTFDAISLSKEVDGHGRRLCESYKGRVGQLVKCHGFLVVTSCNWTKDELLQWFCGKSDSDFTFKLFSEVSYPKFSFGGQTGQSISTVCFQKTDLP